MQRYVELRSCLFDAFANNEWCDPNDANLLWAIIEGVRRMRDYGMPWRRVQANKSHQCVRNCKIGRGKLYFMHAYGVINWSDEAKYCLGCMAMICYFMGVEHLPPILHTHWDLQSKEPVRLDPETNQPR
jgi:hypothetical protein